jgi:predicted ATPase
VQTTTFIGREQEIADIKRLLLDEPGCRLLTLVGPGGIGKTRLALATAVQLLNAFPNGTYFVSLASVTEAEDIVPAMATALNLTFYGQREPKEQLLDYLRSKKLLIVADNFEHLLGKSHLFTEIISQAPEVSLLVTSRERLNLQEEWSYDVQGLSFPVGLAAEEVEATQGLETYSSLKLFLQRASRATASFTPTPEETADIIRICQLVQGMPLGIELAASWARAMTCREIADEIEHNLDFLTTPLRNIPERHRSLRVVFEQTWDRLSLEEQTVLQQLSVFRGGCTREAAEHVTGATLSALSALIDKALLHRTNTGRYELHELIRQFAEGKLSAIDQAKTTRDAHCTYFANFLYQRESDLKGRRQKTAANEIETDIENVRIAWNWAVEQAHVELLSQALGGLGLAYEWYGRYQEGERTYDYATKKLTEIKTSQGQGTLINILIWQARFGEVLGKNDHASQLLHQAQALLETPALATQDTRSEQTAILMGLGRVAYNHGDFRTAEQFYEQSLALYRKLNDRWEEAQALLALEGVGRNHLESGDLKKFQQQAEASKQLVLESLVIFRSLGDQANVARGNLVLGFVFMTLGQGIEAQLALEECITICKDLGRSNNINLIWATGTLGLIKGWYFGLYEQMRAEAQVMRDLAQELGFSEGTMLGLGYTGLAALAQGAYQETQQIFQEFVVLGQPKGDRNNLASNLAILGFATRKLGDKIQAHHYLAKSLQISLEIRAFRGALYGLPLAALLLADYGDIVRAIEVQALVWSFPIIANSHWCEDVAGRHLTAVANTIPANVVAAAQTRGQKRNLWTTIEELLAVFIEDEPDGDS